MTSDRCRGIVRLFAADLGKAHRADVQAELLLSLSSVHQAQIQHREPGSCLTSVLDHRLSPLPIWFLRGSHSITHLQLTSVCSTRTYRAAILHDRVPQTGVSLRSQFLAVSPSEDQSFIQLAAFVVFVGHRISAVEGDVLMRLCGQKLE